MTCGGSNFNDFPENQFTKCVQFKLESRQIGATAYHALFCSKQDFSVFTTVNNEYKQFKY